jgi:hypothetical protein
MTRKAARSERATANPSHESQGSHGPHPGTAFAGFETAA